MKTLICNCNRTMALDGAALAQALQQVPGSSGDGLQTVHSLLCRREAPAFQRAAKGGDELLVACTQEQRLFLELNEQTEGAPSTRERPIRFVNLRETAGWSRNPNGQALGPAQTTPKLAALIAAAQRPEPEPVPTVTYRSQGRCLVIGPADRAEAAARQLDDKLDVALLCTPSPAVANKPGPHGFGAHSTGLPQQRLRQVHASSEVRIRGWLGQFTVGWTHRNPIDLDLCTRCNACVEACPEGAIGLDYQIDLGRCKSHRDCVQRCDAAGAIDFQRQPQAFEEAHDLILDLREEPAFDQHQPPQGYWHVPPASPANALSAALMALRERVGEFDKPKFFQYRQKVCAHSRNEQIGCRACIDVCSAQAVRSEASLKGRSPGLPRARGPSSPQPVGGLGGGIAVEPYLCVGCGACTTVCPSGALSYHTPTVAEQGARVRTMLQAWRAAGGFGQPGAPVLLIHSQERGTQLIDALGRTARLGAGAGGSGAASVARAGLRGLPARVLPLVAWHVASLGLDLWLSALCFGAAQVQVLLCGDEAPQYRMALQEQADLANALWQGLGHAGAAVRLVAADEPDALDRELAEALRALAAAEATRRPFKPAVFAVQADKRATLDLCIDHLIEQGTSEPSKAPEEIKLPGAQAFGASPWGTLELDTGRCTLCLSCVGACPESALADNPDAPQLRFVEKNCVQCGLCASTCPEQAITLRPRLWLADGGKARKAMRVLHHSEPYSCVRCNKPFGTLRAIENMISKLAAHAAFQGAAAERLKMCGDCRVIDLHSNPHELRITDL